MDFQYYWADIAVIVVILIFIGIGYKNGLLRMVYTLVSFAAAILIAWLLYPVMVDLLKGFGLEGTLGDLVRTNYIAPQAADSSLTITSLPAYLQSMVQTGRIALEDAMTSYVVNIILNIAAFLIVLILARLIIMIVGGVIKVVQHLPVIGCLNHIGGLLFGAFEGVVIVYLVLAVVAAVTPLRENPQVNQYIEDSVLTKQMYQNNLFVNILKPTEYDDYVGGM